MALQNETHVKCLCKKQDGTPCDWVGKYKNTYWHLSKNHGEKQEFGRTFDLELTGLPLTHGERKPYTHKTTASNGVTGKAESVYMDIPCKLRINRLTGDRVVILSE